MKFFRMFEQRLMNEATDLGSDGGSGDSAGENIADSSDANDSHFSDNTPIDSSMSQSMKDLGLDPNKYGLDAESDDAPSEESQGSEEDQAASQEAPDENAILDQINSLGAIHNDTAFKVESLEEAKNLIQMGKDYTVKTQALSQERKDWEAEKTGAETEINTAIEEFNNTQKVYGERLQQLQVMDHAVDYLKENAPDIYEEVIRAVTSVRKQYDNPILNQQLASVRAELADAKKSLSLEKDEVAQEKNKLIVGSFDTEKTALSATEQSMKELGVTVDWAKVKERWANSGMPVKDVVGSLYFDQMTKAQASKSKVANVKQKVAAKPVGAAGKGRSGTSIPQVDKKLNHFDTARALLQRYQNN